MDLCGIQIQVLLASVMATTVRVSTPLVLGALSGLYCERSGVVNIAIEGMMVMGAFSTYVVGSMTGSLWFGLLGGIISAALLALLHALLSVTYKVDQIISGTVINILAFGLTGYFYDQFFARSAPSAGRLPVIEIPFLSSLPTFGGLFKQQPVVWASLLLVAITHFVLFYNRWGLRTRAVGEHPRAADTVGINVYFMRYANVVLGGLIAGLAGTYFIQEVNNFTPGMTAGRGFIALAALIFGKWTPLGAWGAALLFGLAQAVQINIQQCGITLPSGQPFPSQFIGMIPYVVTIKRRGRRTDGALTIARGTVQGRPAPPCARRASGCRAHRCRRRSGSSRATCRDGRSARLPPGRSRGGSCWSPGRRPRASRDGTSLSASA